MNAEGTAAADLPVCCSAQQWEQWGLQWLQWAVFAAAFLPLAQQRAEAGAPPEFRLGRRGFDSPEGREVEFLLAANPTVRCRPPTPAHLSPVRSPVIRCRGGSPSARAVAAYGGR